MSVFPPAGGQLGQAIRTMDWSGTGLGDPDGWPQSLRTIVQMMLAQRHAICLFWGPDLRILYNDAYAPLLGAKEKGALGQPFRQVWSEVWDQLKPLVDEALAGRGTWSEELSLVLNRHGYDEQTYFTLSYSPLYDDAGQVAGLINVAVDATATVVSRRDQQILQRELVHRVKNTMAVVTAVVSSSLRHATNMDEARHQVGSRIAALGRAQELVSSQGDEAEIAEIVQSGVSAHMDSPDRISIRGPKTLLSAQQAVGLSLAIYELATNAAKYGALSGEAGRVDISWDTDEDGSFRFSWTESGGPQVSTPTKTGFGSRLTNSIVASYFSGTGETHYRPDGVQFELLGNLG